MTAEPVARVVYENLPGGSEVRRALALQLSGQLASSNPQQLIGPVQDKVWTRYVDSFGHPIPERFIDESFKE